MKTKDFLKYLVRNKQITVSKMSDFKISFDDIKAICEEFNWTIEEKDGVIKFLDETKTLIEDFSQFSVDDKRYKHIVLIFNNQNDCTKLRDTFPVLKEKGTSIDLSTKKIVFDSIDSIEVFNTKRVIDAKFISANCLNKITHSEKTWEQFDNWRCMPEYYFNFKKDIYTKIDTYFNRKSFSDDDLSKILLNNITKKTDSLWYPPKEKSEFTYYRMLGGNEDPKFPIFVISKGRYDVFKYHTSQSLSRMSIHHYLCVEPQEMEKYKSSRLCQSKYCHPIEMDMEYKKNFDPLSDIGTTENHGPGPARNFCGDYARKLGAKWCWILDDNTEDFFRVWRGRRFLAFTPEVFRSCERFVERYENIAIAGLNYHMFVINQDPRPPMVINTRIFSYHLWNLEAMKKLGVVQRGRYNDDVILSIDLLEKGWCSVLFNCYLGRKLRTQLLKGGCTTDIYQEKFGGTFAKSQQLCEVFPQYTSLTWKFNRWHHEVNYNVFNTKLKIKPEYEYMLKDDYNKIDEGGAYIVRIDPKYHLDPELDNREFLEKMYPKGCPEDITKDLMYLPDDRNNIELRNFWEDETPGPITYQRGVRHDDEESIQSCELFEDLSSNRPDKTKDFSDTKNDKLVLKNIANINNSIVSKVETTENFSIDDL